MIQMENISITKDDLTWTNAAKFLEFTAKSHEADVIHQISVSPFHSSSTTVGSLLVHIRSTLQLDQ